MNSRVSRSVEDIDPFVRERAEAAARRAGVSLNDWLTSTLGDFTPPDFRAPADQRLPGQETPNVADIHQRLDAITRQIEQITRPAPLHDAPRGDAVGSEPGVARQLNDAISRLEQMIGMAGMPMTIASVRGQISAAIRVIVQLQRLSDGKRKVTAISEITGLEGDILQMQDIYKYVRTGTASDGTVEGHFQATGVRPRFLSELVARGINIPGAYFDPSKPL